MEDIINDYEEKFDNIMNDYDTEFVNRTAIGNSGIDISEAVIHEEDNSNGSNIIPKRKPIETVVKIAKPDSEPENDGDDVPVSYLVAKKGFVWKWNKRFENPKLNKFSLAEEGIETINLENPSSFQVFTEMIDLQGLLIIIKIESERYAAQNGRVLQTKKAELSAFLGINILMGISRSPSHKILMVCRIRIRQSTNQKDDEKATILGNIIVSNVIVHGNSYLCLTTY